MGALRATVARPSPAVVDARDRLILALDVPDVSRAWELVKQLDGVVHFYKLGPWLTIAEGFENLLSSLVQMDHSIFLDSKGQDIPETMRAGVASAARRGIRFLTIHGNGEVSDDAMRAAIKGRTGNLKVFSVTVLTSLDQSDLTSTGYGSLDSVVKDRVEKAIRCGCDGVIASAHEARMIKDLAKSRNKPDFLVTTPGIRPTGSKTGDHKRPATPSFAIGEGADYLVVGRPIIHSADPVKAAREIIEEMQGAFDSRVD
jgi:orotidine-5'-phosphate decarboxylase